MFLEVPAKQQSNFACFSVPLECQLAKDQLAINFHLKAATFTGNKGQAFDLAIKRSKYFIRRTDGL